MWNRKRTEWLPWYRARNYKGNLTEAEKRQLDAFRMQPKHPAAREEDLPEEVQSYIGRIELKLYGKKQDGALGRAMFLSAIGVGLLFVTYKGYTELPTTWSYTIALLAVIAPWAVYWEEWNKNAEEFLPSAPHYNPTDEAIRREWELEYILRNKTTGARRPSP